MVESKSVVVEPDLSITMLWHFTHELLVTTWCHYLQTKVPAPGALSDPAGVQIGQA